MSLPSTTFDYLHPMVNLSDRKLFTQQMLQCWQPLLGLSEEENERAVEEGFKAWHEYEDSIRSAPATSLTCWSTRIASAW